MATTIVIKNSAISGKVPDASALVTAELAINLTDQKLYSKDTSGAVFEIGGASVGQGPTPPGNGNETGDLWWDGDVLLVWNGSDWEVVGGVTSVNGKTGDVVLNLGDLNDVNLSLGVSNGDIIAWNGTAWVNTAAPPADISGSSINDLNDVDTTGADDGDILLWNEAAGEWQATDRGTVPENTSDLVNDGEDGTNPFITEADVNNILGGNNIDGTPNPGAAEYLQAGDNVSELFNDAGYITDAGVTKIIAGDSINITPAEGTGEVQIDVAIDASGVVINLDDLNDVNVPSPDAGDVLSYDGGEWVSSAAPPADISGSSINQLNDVDAAGANNGDMLIWQTDNWVNTPAPTKTSDFTNDGDGDINNPFITEGGVTNILNGLNPDGTPNAGAEGYLKPGDNVSELYNDAKYITDKDTAADSNKLCGEDCDYYLNYQNLTNTPDIDGANLWVEDAGRLYPKTLTNNVHIGGIVSDPNIQLAADGTGSFIQVNSTNVNSSGIGTFNSSVVTRDITASGDVTVDGKVTSASTEDSDSGTTLVTKDYLEGAGSGGTGALGYWNRTGTALSPVNISDDVKTDGSITAAGTIQSQGDAVSGTANGSSLAGEGGLHASSNNPIQNLVRCYTTGNSTPTASINAAGNITAVGKLLLGTTTLRRVGTPDNDTLITAEAAQGETCGLNLVQNRSVDRNGSYVRLAKSRGSVVGSSDIVISGDDLGTVQFCGADGVDVRSVGASISSRVDGSPGVGDMPGSLIFSTTAAGASSPTERLRINSSGSVIAAGTVTTPHFDLETLPALP